jgi:DNA-binding NarL/FixJ family response regulator
METVRVLIADDHTLFREGLRALLASVPDIEVVGEAATGQEALVKAGESSPDVILYGYSDARSQWH